MAFSFPSIASVVKGALDTLKRFPFPLASAVLASSICIYIINDWRWSEKQDLEYLWKIVMCCWLGFNLFFSFSLISERRNHAVLQKYLFQFLGLIMIVAYYFLLPDFSKMTIADGSRYALFVTGLHLLVAFSPFIGRGEINGFWQFNKTLFLRFLLSILYTGVLYLGLALALTAINQLFNVDFNGTLYGQLWYFLAGIFNTWFFLAGVPQNLDELETNTDYPKGLKIFTQFVLLPLVTIYLLILYAYGIKIIFQWHLPKGWVSWLVNAFSVFGILSLLLIWPIRNEEGNKWISTFSRWFYRALFPLIVLLVVAIGKRVVQYGITENRYFVLVVAMWLVGIAAYFLFSKTKNIKYIPVSLCLIAFLSSFGPWGAFSVSEKSQVKRLETLLIKEKILVNGKIKKATDTVSTTSSRQISSIIHYLNRSHGFDKIDPWFTQNLDSVVVSPGARNYKYNYYDGYKLLELMGVEEYGYYRGDREEDEEDTLSVKNFNYYAENENTQAVPVKGFDYSCNFNHYFNEDRYDDYNQFYFGKDTGIVKYSNEKKQFVFSKNGKEILHFEMNDFVKCIRACSIENKNTYYGNIPKDKMAFEVQNDSVRLKLYLSAISGTVRKSEINITSVSGLLLLGFGPFPLQTDTIHGSIKKH